MTNTSSIRRSGCLLVPVLVLVLVLVPGVPCGAAVPDFTSFQLQARSNIVDGYNLPPNSSFNSGTPALNDGGRVAFRLIYIGGGPSGIWVGGDGAGTVVYTAPADLFVEDPSINAAGLVAFEQFDVFTDGVFVYDPASGDTTLAVPPGGMFGIDTVTRAQINDANVLGFRAGNFGGNRYMTDDGGVQTSFVAEADGRYGFLFTASFNDEGRLAGKVRVGGTDGSLPDEIRVFALDGSSVLMAVDDDGDPLSPYTGFDNSIDFADDGRVAFIATLGAGGRGVFLTDGATTTTIATTDDAAVSVVEFFPPALSDGGLVAFRGRDEAGLDAIFVGDGSMLRRVVGEHDLLPSDLGEARIDQHDGSVTFGGAVDINAFGDVVFNCALTPPDDDQVEWGSGIYVAYAARPGDVNGDLVVDFADLLAVLSEWGQAGSPADVNGDGVVDFTDLLVVLSNWS